MKFRVRVVSVIAAALLIAAVILLASGFWSHSSGANRLVYGKATTYGPGYDGLLALPDGRGHRVTICSSHSGSRRCVTQTSNDTGPNKKLGRVADLDLPTFKYLCGCSKGNDWRAVGIIEVRVEYLPSKASSPQPTKGASQTPRPTLPPTDTTGD